jgi:hypothetical protein
VCDAHSQSMHDRYSVLCDPEEDNKEIRYQFAGMDSDMLVLDYVLLHPKWRGLMLGLLAVRKMVDLLGGGCGLAVAEILPLRHEAHESLRVPKSSTGAWMSGKRLPESGGGTSGAWASSVSARRRTTACRWPERPRRPRNF